MAAAPVVAVGDDARVRGGATHRDARDQLGGDGPHAVKAIDAFATELFSASRISASIPRTAASSAGLPRSA